MLKILLKQAKNTIGVRNFLRYVQIGPQASSLKCFHRLELFAFFKFIQKNASMGAALFPFSSIARSNDWL